MGERKRWGRVGEREGKGRERERGESQRDRDRERDREMNTVQTEKTWHC